MRVNWHLWSGVMRPSLRTKDHWGKVILHQYYPTVVIDVALNDWALPLAIHGGGPLLGKPGVTVTIGPVKIGWSKL